MAQDISRLIAALRSDDAGSRQVAAEELATLGPDAAPAAVALVETCAVDDDATRELCAAALEELGCPDSGDRDALAALLSDPLGDVAYWAATLLGRMKGDAAAAVNPLARALVEHPDLAARQRAAWALGKIGPAASAARDALEQAAADSDPRLSRLAQSALDGLSK